MNEISPDQLDAARQRLQAQVPSSYLTIPEAMELARCSEKTIRRAFGSGALRAFRPTNRVLFREEDVRAWIESRSAIPEPPAPRRTRRSRSKPGSVAELKAIDRELSR